jgi:hypothetical protein
MTCPIRRGRLAPATVATPAPFARRKIRSRGADSAAGPAIRRTKFPLATAPTVAEIGTGSINLP